MMNLIAENRIWFGQNGDNTPRYKRYLSEMDGGMVPVSILYHKDVNHSQGGRQELKSLFEGKGYFDGPKPVRLIRRLLTISNSTDNDIILDFFSGSATTAHAAANFRKEVTSTVVWLRDHGVDITCIKVTPYNHGDKLYLDVEQILPIQDIGDYQIRLTAKKQEENISSKEEASRYKLRYQFWEKALPKLRAKSGIYNNVSPTKDNGRKLMQQNSNTTLLPFKAPTVRAV